MECSKLKPILRPICEQDAEMLMELNNCEEVSKYVVGNPHKVTLEQQIIWMSKVKNEKNTRRWIIEYDGNAVGTVILSSIDLINKVGNINIKLLPSSQGKGVAKYALINVCIIAFNEMQMFCLTANVLSYNEKSKALFKKVGFKEDGVLRGRVLKKGERYDLIAFSLLKDDLYDAES